MRAVDKYIDYKAKYENYVILVKAGNFYNTFDEDCYFLSHYFNYKTINNKIGFPVSSLHKVEFFLLFNNISIVEVVSDENYIIKHGKLGNNYEVKLEEIKESENFKRNIKVLLKDLEMKIKNNKDIYKVMRELVDEL